jgi:hypothetical protein
MKLDPTGSMLVQGHAEPGRASAPQQSVDFGATLESAQDALAWQTAISSDPMAPPKLVNVDSAIAGGLADMQSRLQGLLAARGSDPSANIRLTYDAASQLFQVEAPTGLKAALESELNKQPQTLESAALRVGYMKLADMTVIADVARAKYAQDHDARLIGSTDAGMGAISRFSLVMRSGKLSYELAPT